MLFVFFKQKTAYEMRISDWSSDVCSSDLDPFRSNGECKNGKGIYYKALGRNKKSIGLYLGDPESAEIFLELVATADVVVESFRAGKIGRASCRERVCQSV